MTRPAILFIAALSLLAAAPAFARALTRAEQDELDRISDAYNAMHSLEASFAQIGPDGEIKEGKVYIKKPGDMRFEYAPPADTLVVCDGLDIAVFNLKLHTVDRYPLSTTPLAILLSDHVNLAGSNVVTGIAHQPGQVIVDARSSDRRVSGRIEMVFSDPGYQLRQWTVTDPQGLTTTVTLSNLRTGVDLPDNIFSLKGRSGN
ncbi:MAG TPA: outer-membrane lipoprotein carrier protein LolA [Rhizomicrobium sp.]|nr:outer-membrane lipoprotein carrier protein LolA [Rhizomicrobium sp.]